MDESSGLLLVLLGREICGVFCDGTLISWRGISGVCVAALQPILGWEFGDKRALSLSDDALEEEALSSMAGLVRWDLVLVSVIWII